MNADTDRDGATTRSARRPILCGEEVPKAGHICAFFDSNAEKSEVLASYFNDAIRSGDRVIDVVEAGTREEHLRGMIEAGVDMHAAVESGTIQLSTCEETYFRDGRLELEAVLDMLRDELHSAQEDGTSLRTCGDMNWVARDPSLRQRAIEYEMRVNEFLPTFDCTMLCVYDLAHTPSMMIADILATHPFAVIKGRLRTNPWAVDPQEFVEMTRSRPASASESMQRAGRLA